MTNYSKFAIKDNDMTWRIEFYKAENGSIPVKEFVDSLSESAQAKFIFIVDLLEKYGLEVREPYIKSMAGHRKLKELRIKTKDNIYRVMFFPFKDKAFILLHGFEKRSQKTPVQEIETAEKRMKVYLEKHT